jgi:hypothetical protein
VFEIKQYATTKIPVKLVSSTDFSTPVTGVASPSIYYSKNGGASTSASFTWGVVSNANIPGLYLITPTSGMTDTPGPLCIGVSGASCSPTVIVVDVVANLESDTYTLALLSKKILSNKTVDNGTSIVLYDDNGTTVLGTFTWTDSTGTRGKLT